MNINRRLDSGQQPVGQNVVHTLLSSYYLNEAIKKTTGLSVGDYIRNEIVLQAKRLLFYTNLSVKEIASSLGYDDYAYFTRLFTKSAGVSPTQFKAHYRK
jgi:YesN/AraC family two-component response regulator